MSIALVWIFSAPSASAASLQCASAEIAAARSGFAVENFVSGSDLSARIILPGVLRVGDRLNLSHNSSESFGYEYYEGTVASGIFPSAQLWINPKYIKDNGRFPGELVLGPHRMDLVCLFR